MACFSLSFAGRLLEDGKLRRMLPCHLQGLSLRYFMSQIGYPKPLPKQHTLLVAFRASTQHLQALKLQHKAILTTQNSSPSSNTFLLRSEAMLFTLRFRLREIPVQDSLERSPLRLLAQCSIYARSHFSKAPRVDSP